MIVIRVQMGTSFKKHVKRVSVKKQYKIGKMSGIFTIKIKSGKQNKYDSIPLFLIIKKYLKFGKTYYELKNLIKNGFIFVNGKKCFNINYPVGLSDTLSIPIITSRFRLFLNTRGNLKLYKIGVNEENFKISIVQKIENLNDGFRKLITNDQRYYLSKDKEIQKFNTVLVNSLNNKIIYCLNFDIGNLCLVIRGSRKGCVAAITYVSNNKIIHLMDKKGKKLLKFNRFVKSLVDLMVIGESAYPFLNIE
uniref:Ribosomal protein S4 n=1 Tax=Amorphochlora amoebiformis TaxID=1561963 RepID=A0A0H5BKR3_9EUKA|nr:ribosomal protein S4 [Amorphochlora amoebiformis]